MRIKSTNFNIEQIAESGQCFRMNQVEVNRYQLVAYHRFIELLQVDHETVDISCTKEEYQQIWETYFDLTYDYESIVTRLSMGEDPFLKKAASYGNGIRILKQEPYEMLISFIISQNKNIPSIKCCIERICEVFGERKISSDSQSTVYYTFPKPEMLAAASGAQLRELKLGYRDDYIIRASEAVASKTIDLPGLISCDFGEAVRTLKTLRGVGDKVANCIALYGLHHIEAFPVDVWIARVIKEIYNNQFNAGLYPGFAGIVQQYLFYYMRHLKGVSA